jgi:hypothetical protein
MSAANIPARTARPNPTVNPPNTGAAVRVAGSVKLKISTPNAPYNTPSKAVSRIFT